MHSISYGIFTLQASHLLWVGSFILAAGIGHLVGRPQKVGIVDVLTEMTLAAAIAARLIFVLEYAQIYFAHPLTILDIRDGGFSLWAAFAAASAVGGWRCWKRQELIAPLSAGMLAAFVVWNMSGSTHLPSDQTNSVLPTTQLSNFEGTQTTLSALANGKPVVLNLWASWCPPCRREMPILVEEQRRHPEIAFIFVNEDSDPEAAKTFLAEGALNLRNLLTDKDGEFAHDIGITAFPTTIFYDARQNLKELHIGGLSEASLTNYIEKIRDTRPIESPTNSPSPSKR